MGILEGLVTGAASAGYSAKAAATAFKRQKEILKNQVQWRVNDYEGAGLNKYLAVTGGGGGSSASVPMAAQVDFSRSANTAKDFKKLKPEMAILKNNATRSAHDAEAAGYAASSAKDISIRNSLETELAIGRKGYEASREGLRDDTLGAAIRGGRNFIRQRNNPVSRRDARRKFNDGVKTIKNWFGQ